MIPFVWSDAVLRHDPRHEIWVGAKIPGTEVPERAEVIRSALVAARHPQVPATAYGDELLDAVHEPAMTAWLRTAAERWEQGPYREQVGADRVVPYVFPTPMMTAGVPWRYPTAAHAQAGVWCYDTMTLIGPGTWEAARAAVDVALTAVDLVFGLGERAAYALTRPPGHHATPAGFGGSCYLNNAAVAAEAISRRGLRVAVLDVDAHHGNGTQAVFWNRPEVLYGSVHVDPGAGWFPYLQGFEQETGGEAAPGGVVNVPVAPGSGDEPWLAGVRRLVDAAIRFEAQALVVSLGLDAIAAAPKSPLQVTPEGYAMTAALLAALDLPTVLVQEGGHRLDSLGELVATALAPF